MAYIRLLALYLCSHFQLIVHAQNLAEKPACLGMPASEQQRINQKAKQFHTSIPQLKTWMKDQDQTLQLQNNHVLFSWPLKVHANYDDIPVYYNTWFFWDMAAGSTIRDWKCSNKAYDGHNGVVAHEGQRLRVCCRRRIGSCD